jgi:hypothetical protein
MKVNISDVTAVYADDNENRLGSDYVVNGTTYKFVKVAANSNPIARYDYVTNSTANVCTLGLGVRGAKQSGVCAAKWVPTSTSVQYIYIVVSDETGYPVNIASIVTASADYDTKDFVASASGTSGMTHGRVVSAATPTVVSAAYSSAEVNNAIASAMVIESARIHGAGIASAYSGDRTVSGITIFTSGLGVSVTAPVSGTFKCGDVVWYGGVPQIITGVTSGSADVSAFMVSGGGGWSALSAASAGNSLSVGTYRCPSIFE